MKTRRGIPLLTVGITVLLPACVGPTGQRAQAGTPIDGVWEYINPGMHGGGIMVDGHYVYFALSGDSMVPPGPLADSVQARLYRALNLDAGTYSVSDTLVTAKTEFSKDPRQVGVTWHWSFSFNGDTATYRLLDADGKPTTTGRSVRVRR